MATFTPRFVGEANYCHSMHTDAVSRPTESQSIRARHFLGHESYRDESALSLPFIGVPPEYAALENGSYTCVRGRRHSRRRLLMLTVRDAMLQHHGISITAILPRDNEFRWLSDLYASFSRIPLKPDGPPPPGWDADWHLVQVTAGASVDRLRSALSAAVDLVIVDGLEALSPAARRAFAASDAFDEFDDLHDPLISHARWTDAVVLGGIDVSTELLSPDRIGRWDGTLDLEGMHDRVTRSRGGTRLLSEGRAGWIAIAGDPYAPAGSQPQAAK